MPIAARAPALPSLPILPAPPAPSEREMLRHALRHCTPDIFAAACAFRHTKDPAAAATAILGIIERFVPEDTRAALRDRHEPVRLREDLGLDSLALFEIVSLVEDALGLRLTDDALRSMNTVGEVLAAACGPAVSASHAVAPAEPRKEAPDTPPSAVSSRDGGRKPRSRKPRSPAARKN